MRLIALLFLITTNLYAFESIELSGLRELERDGYFELIQVTPKFQKITLDCMSFFHGISFFETGRIPAEGFLMLSDEECVDIYDYQKENPKVILNYSKNYDEISFETVDE